jgi:urease accessory protein
MGGFGRPFLSFLLIPMQKPATLVPAATLAGALLLLSPAAQAHHAEYMSNAPFLQGLSMPVHGLDHLLSAIAVGLVTSQTEAGRRTGLLALYALIALVSGLLNVSGIALPDFAVPITVALTGVLLWKGAANAWTLSALAVAAAGFCHGDALLNRSAGGTHWTLFSAGCLLGTLALCGMALFAGRLVSGARMRVAGAALVVCTLLLVLFPEANGVLVQLIEGPQ